MSQSVRGLNLALALALHVVVGALALGLALWESDTYEESAPGPEWAGFIAVLWFAAAGLMVSWRERHPGLIWLVPLSWALSAWEPMLGLVAVAVGLLLWREEPHRVLR